jgi:hypothetical protein
MSSSVTNDSGLYSESEIEVIKYGFNLYNKGNWELIFNDPIVREIMKARDMDPQSIFERWEENMHLDAFQNSTWEDKSRNDVVTVTPLARSYFNFYRERAPNSKEYLTMFPSKFVPNKPYHKESDYTMCRLCGKNSKSTLRDEFGNLKYN